MKILAIETSCDETAIALLEATGGIHAPKFKIIKSEVSSQIKIHAPFGGVVPNLAKREHIKNLPVVFKDTIGDISKTKLDIIAVTVGPGLEPALWTGIEFAKELKKNTFPLTPLVGDDAVGEAFDKVARVLQLPYPGGPEIEKNAQRGNATAITFPRPMLHARNYDFSFSGLKTAVLYHIRDNPRARVTDVAASFQAAAIDVLVTKTVRAAREFAARSILLSGGVAANNTLRKTFAYESEKMKINFLPTPMLYNTDNAAMIGVAGYLAHIRKKRCALKARGTLNI